MNQGQTVPDPQLINMWSLNFVKPKLFFKNIGRYAATSTYIHVWIPFNFSQILDRQQTIKNTYSKPLAKHEEQFRSIAKSTTDVSLMTIAASIKDFKAFPQMTEISAPGRPKHYIALGLSIAVMTMSSFNAYRITQLNSEITTLKLKIDLLMDISHLRDAHLHHLEDQID